MNEVVFLVVLQQYPLILLILQKLIEAAVQQVTLMRQMGTMPAQQPPQQQAEFRPAYNGQTAAVPPGANSSQQAMPPPHIFPGYGAPFHYPLSQIPAGQHNPTKESLETPAQTQMPPHPLTYYAQHPHVAHPYYAHHFAPNTNEAEAAGKTSTSGSSLSQGDGASDHGDSSLT